MFIDKDSIIINGVSFGKYITAAKYEYPKLWGDDAGRTTLDGEYTGTFLGVFPKFVLTFRKLKPEEIEEIAPILDSGQQTVRYYDPNKRTYIEKETYSGDWGITYSGIRKKVEAFEVSFVCRKKR